MAYERKKIGGRTMRDEQPEPQLVGKHIVSKKRVADHGAVLTDERQVNAMLDLVKSETERIDFRIPWSQLAVREISLRSSSSEDWTS